MGPLLELLHTPRLNLPAEPKWLDMGPFVGLIEAKEKRRNWFEKANHHLGLVWIDDLLADQTKYTSLSQRARAAAEHAGFHKTQSRQIIAAMLELYSNVIEHSSSPETGYISYYGYEGVFEFSVADRGVGLLKSLRTNPKYSGLTDAGTALELALREGVSRHPDAPDRGRGFRPIFVGLANISRHIRFRSDDHICELSRLSDGSIPARVIQKADSDGFSSFVRCEL